MTVYSYCIQLHERGFAMLGHVIWLHCRRAAGVVHLPIKSTADWLLSFDRNICDPFPSEQFSECFFTAALSSFLQTVTFLTQFRQV